MNDPVLNKLAADAAILMRDLWRGFCHQPPECEWQSSRVLPGDHPLPEEPSHSGLCYFHLN